jgi:hypothetical protein
MKVRFSFNENIKALDVKSEKQKEKEEIRKGFLMEPSYTEMLDMSSYLYNRIQRLLKKRRDRDPSFSEEELVKVRKQHDKIEQQLLQYQDLHPDEFEDEFEDELKAEDIPMSGKFEKKSISPYDMQGVLSLLKKFLSRDIPVMLSGYSGFGKSEITSQAATSIPGFPVKKENVLDIRAGMMNVEDLRGIPQLIKNDDPTKAFTASTIPAWLKKVILNTDENFVLFFDELNHASAAVLNSLYGIILERTLEDFKFKERTRIVAAGNTGNENDDVTELSTPLRNRLEIISIDKAVDNDSAFFENYLRNKYEKDIPAQLIDALFAPTETIGNSRDIEKLLKSWVQDIENKDPILTITGGVTESHAAKIQKIYEKSFRPKGSSRIKEVLNEVELAVMKLLKDSPEYAENSYKSYVVSDILQGKIQPKRFVGAGEGLTDAGKQIIVKQFSNESPEILETVFAKLFGE